MLGVLITLMWVSGKNPDSNSQMDNINPAKGISS